VAGNLQFRGIVFCNLGTSKTVISKFVTTRQILLPHILPHVNMTTPTMFPWDKKESIMKKSHPQKCINSFVSHKLSHDHWLWFFWGRLLVHTRRCDLVVPADGGWGRGNKLKTTNVSTYECPL
jgi:hypothetical protein